VTKNRLLRVAKLTLVGLVVLFTTSNTLVGCAGGNAPLARIFGGFPHIRPAEDPVAARSLEEFRSVYAAYAATDSSRAQQLRHFTDAYLRVRADYVQRIDDVQLIAAAVDGIKKIDGRPGAIPSSDVTEAALDSLMASLDPHSSYLNPEEFKDSQVATRGEFGGLGIEINMENGFVKVIAPIEDTPAFHAGLKAGDLITHVDGQSIEGMSLVEAVKLLRGPANTDVRLTIQRESGADETTLFDVTITRAVIQIKPVKWRLEGNIGVIRITSFIQRADDELEDALRALRRQSRDRLQGLVIDLRNNPGGLLNQSVAIADAFLNRGDIVSVRDRDGEGRSFMATPGDLSNGLPVVVLINRGSASASEIVAGALQDHHRAMIMGVRSFGKGSVQTITPLQWDGALRLTTALYYLPSGRSIQGGGVAPDIAITGDAQEDGRREADLPHALQVDQGLQARANAKVRESNCPTAGEKNDDRMLGCAVAYLQDGSHDKFLARFGTQTKL